MPPGTKSFLPPGTNWPYLAPLASTIHSSSSVILLLSKPIDQSPNFQRPRRTPILLQEATPCVYQVLRSNPVGSRLSRVSTIASSGVQKTSTTIAVSPSQFVPFDYLLPINQHVVSNIYQRLPQSTFLASWDELSGQNY